MGARSWRHRIWRRGPFVALSLAACLTMAACGPLGDDEAEPTATEAVLAQPTDIATEAVTEAPADAATEVVEETAAAPEETATAESTPASAPVSFDSTPDLEPISGDESASTPVANNVVTITEGTASAAPGEQATPIPPSLATPQFDGPLPDGDGTSGAMPDDAESAEETPLLVEETPAGAEGTPSASPVAGSESLDDLEVAQVTSCEPEIIPEIALASTAYQTNDDVNIRFGPGADCDTLPISPLGEFMPVTIIGGPVQREGEDFVWVQVEAFGEIGWVVTEALEPVES